MIHSKNQLFFSILIIIAVICLVYLGVRLIDQSNTIYDQSYELTKKVMDSSYTKTIAIPTPNYASVKEGYSQAFSFFMLGLGALFLILLLPRLQNFSVSPTGINITLDKLQSDVENLKMQNNSVQQTLVDTGGSKNISAGKMQEIKAQVLESKTSKTIMTDSDDPQKGRWGKQPEAHGRRLSATVTSAALPSLYTVNLVVESTDVNYPLTGFVTFHLHPTFKNQDPIIAVKNGRAELTLNWVYGAFTVGAEADDGKTKLELDLAQLPGIPDEFRDN